MESRQFLEHETGFLCSHTQGHTMCWTFAFTLDTRSLTVFIQDATTSKAYKTGSVFTAPQNQLVLSTFWLVCESSDKMAWWGSAAKEKMLVFSSKLPFKQRLLIKRRLDEDQSHRRPIWWFHLTFLLNIRWKWIISHNLKKKTPQFPRADRYRRGRVAVFVELTEGKKKKVTVEHLGGF